MTNFIMSNKVFSKKYALKPVPDLADVGVPHGVGDGSELHPEVWSRSGKSFKLLILLCLTIYLL